MNGKANLNIWLSVWVLVLLLAGQAADGKIILVPGEFDTIQGAIDDANDGDKIVVSPSKYNELINFNGKAITLLSIHPDDPNVVGTTIIDGNGLADCVVTCASGEGPNTILTGLTITGGSSISGGGMYNFNSSPTVTKCIFKSNTASYGGGMFNNLSKPTVTNCTFENNASLIGGGMYNVDSNSTVTNCTFIDNTCTDSGGGIYNNFSNLTLTNCSFHGNSAVHYGGGIYNDHNTPTLTNCVFSNNTAHYGGGMYNRYSNSKINDCTFTSNDADYGGGIYGRQSSSKINNCTFTSNDADYGGGMYNYDQSTPAVTNCIFTGNTASNNGGGMANLLSSPTVTNCTFTGNSAFLGGDGVHNENSSPTVTNCILWDDGPEEIYDNAGSSSTVSYSDVRGGWSGAGGNNINGDPRFIAPATGDLRLLRFSPCVDAANNNAVPATITTDLDGNPRFVDDTGVVDTGAGIPPLVDMGAYERQVVSEFWTVPVDFETIQEAIDFLIDGDEIVVEPGEYFENIDFLGKAIRLYSRGGPEVTIIDANGAYHVVQCVSGEDSDTVLEGFTVTGGNAISSWFLDDCGGGMYNNDSSPTVTNCIFSGNWADAGGGMYNLHSSPTVINCTFSDNGATWGAGMCNVNSSPTVKDCTFSGHSSVYGGGMYNNQGCSPMVIHCTFKENWAEAGGGMCNRNDSSPTVTNCTFRDNTTTGWGGGMSNAYSSSPALTSCTFSNNHSLFGGAVDNYSYCNLELSNCILWYNTANNGLQVAGAEGSTVYVSYSNLEGGREAIHVDRSTTIQWDWGNIDTDPLFVDAAGGVLRLRPNSPCIDAGDNISIPGDITTDLNGLPRFIDDLCEADTGNGSAPIVDMGAYEFLPADIDRSGAVDLVDLARLALHWAETVCGRCDYTNLNCEGAVDFKDLAILCGNWLAGADPEL